MITPVKHRVIAKTANYQVNSQRDRSGTIFTNRGASGTVVFTLPPTPKYCLGWEYTFVGVANQTITVQTVVPDTLVALNDTAADSLSLSTASQKIGGVIRAMCDGTSWVVWGGAAGAAVTVAT
jgi:hypothetical protein